LESTEGSQQVLTPELNTPEQTIVFTMIKGVQIAGEKEMALGKIIDLRTNFT
jgi:hypothetical protein